MMNTSSVGQEGLPSDMPFFFRIDVMGNNISQHKWPKEYLTWACIVGHSHAATGGPFLQ